MFLTVCDADSFQIYRVSILQLGRAGSGRVVLLVFLAQPKSSPTRLINFYPGAVLLFAQLAWSGSQNDFLIIFSKHIKCKKFIYLRITLSCREYLFTCVYTSVHIQAFSILLLLKFNFA